MNIFEIIDLDTCETIDKFVLNWPIKRVCTFPWSPHKKYECYDITFKICGQFISIQNNNYAETCYDKVVNSDDCLHTIYDVNLKTFTNIFDEKDVCKYKDNKFIDNRWGIYYGYFEDEYDQTKLNKFREEYECLTEDKGYDFEFTKNLKYCIVWTAGIYIDVYKIN